MFVCTGPIQTILVSTRAKTKLLGKEMLKDNVMAADWHTPCSFEPMIYAVSIGKTRFTHELIKKSRVFVINFMPYELKEKVLLCGRTSGKTTDKFKEAGLAKEEAEKIDCCRIKEAIAWLECETINEIDAGDHTIFVGKILGYREKTRARRPYHVAGNDFTTTKDS